LQNLQEILQSPQKTFLLRKTFLQNMQNLL